MTNPRIRAQRQPRWKQLRAKRPKPEAIREEFGFGQAPVIVERILRSIGVEIVEEFDGPGTGKLQLSDERAVIWFRSGESRDRRRFNMAYMLALLLMKPNGEYHAGEDRDAEALEYAKDLMMPDDLVHEATRASSSPLHFLFGVPKQVMDGRLIELGLEPTDPGAGEDRREFERVPAKIEVRFMQAGEAARALKAYSIDLSVGGLCLKTRRKYEVGELLKLGMSVEEQEFKLTGVVTWARNGAIGVRFENLTSADRQRLGRIVTSLGDSGPVSV